MAIRPALGETRTAKFGKIWRDLRQLSSLSTNIFGTDDYEDGDKI